MAPRGSDVSALRYHTVICGGTGTRTHARTGLLRLFELFLRDFRQEKKFSIINTEQLVWKRFACPFALSIAPQAKPIVHDERRTATA